ncbi:STAS/SEC14 domain-containing protein [Anabaena sp. UHCC 0187]|nr:STAS/SEC14 domain-containing protein [Anabaena sp. UHCC 0187]
MKVEVQFSSEDLLKAVGQLSQSDLRKFISQAIAIQAQRTTSSLMQRESELLLKINQGIPLDIQQYYHDLIAKRDAEILTNDEYRELLGLTEQIEKQQVQQIEYLAELASLKGIALNTLMENLGIQTQSYV